MSDMLKALRPKLSPDLTGKKSYRGPYTYSFTKKEEFVEHQENKVAGWRAGADLSQTLWNLCHLKMHRRCLGMDYFGSLGVCGMFQIVFLFRGVGLGGVGEGGKREEGPKRGWKI